MEQITIRTSNTTELAYSEPIIPTTLVDAAAPQPASLPISYSLRVLCVSVCVSAINMCDFYQHEQTHKHHKQ